MNVTSRWSGVVVLVLSAAWVGCGDDESAEGSGGGGGDPATSTSTGDTTGSTSTGGTVDCPEIPPVAGAECSPPDAGSCPYEQEAFCPNGDFTTASIDATCSGGVWELEVASSGECCPVAPQQSGAVECFIEGSACEYIGDVVCADGGTIGGTVVSTCDGETWQTVYEPTGGVCEGETACPTSPPAIGDACDGALFQDGCIWERASPCDDGPGFNVITVAACNPVDQAWEVGTFFEGTECAGCASEVCDPDGMACVYETSCDGGNGTVTVGAVCVLGESDTVWEVRDCE